MNSPSNEIVAKTKYDNISLRTELKAYKSFLYLS